MKENKIIGFCSEFDMAAVKSERKTPCGNVERCFKCQHFIVKKTEVLDFVPHLKDEHNN